MAIFKPVLAFPFESPKFQKRASNPTSTSHHNHYIKRLMIICNSYYQTKSSLLSSDKDVLLHLESQKMVEEFHPNISLEEAVTPPSSWYTDPKFLSLELDRVFYRGWQVVGFTEQMRKAYDFFTGRLGKAEYVISRDENGKLHAFHNVCRHRASLISSGCGQKSCFVCPYHGWTYGMDGTLLKATRISGIENFSKNNFGLVPIQVSTWGPFILINLDEDMHHDYHQNDEVIATKTMEKQWLGSSSEILSTNGIDSSLSYVSRHEYTINSNWKVFIDNFIDGGYHVPYAHAGFSSGFNLDTYTTTIYDKFSIQECESAPNEKDGALSRIGSRGFYVFVFPNLLINRYGPWMETNRVYPIGPNKCQVVSDYFLEPSLKDAQDFIDSSIQESERVLMEDIVLCENVQRGLESPSYSTGRYVPGVERANHHFHSMLYHNLIL